MRDYFNHGHRHATDGSDPIPGLGGAASSGWGLGRFISVTASLPTTASGTTYAVDFTGKSVTSNDASSTDTSGTHSSPFAGDNFSVDWSSDAFHISINTEGVYLVHRVFEITLFAAFATPSSDFDMEMVMTGSNPTAVASPWLVASEQVNIVQLMPKNASLWVIRDTQLFVNEGYTSTVGLSVLQKSGLSTGTAAAGIAVVRLGSVLSS